MKRRFVAGLTLIAGVLLVIAGLVRHDLEDRRDELTRLIQDEAIISIVVTASECGVYAVVVTRGNGNSFVFIPPEVPSQKEQAEILSTPQPLWHTIMVPCVKTNGATNDRIARLPFSGRHIDRRAI
jgi:hypothetical protein